MNPMTEEPNLEQRVEELKDRVEIIKKYYYKGFGAIVTGIVSKAEICLDRPEKRITTEHEVLELYSRLERFYQKIPLDKLEGNQDFAPLVVAYKMMPKLKWEIEEYFKKPDKWTLEKLLRASTSIVDVGMVYKGNLKNAIEEVRKTSGNETYTVELIDDNGNKFLM
jgi:hypothetical protein